MRSQTFMSEAGGEDAHGHPVRAGSSGGSRQSRPGRVPSRESSGSSSAVPPSQSLCSRSVHTMRWMGV